MQSQVALGNITVNKAIGGNGIQGELFQILKDDAVKVLCSIYQQIWKSLQFPQDWKRTVFIPIPKKVSAKGYSNCCTIELISQSYVQSFKLGFSSTWTKNFNMYKLALRKAEEQETKLSTFVGSYRKQENVRKIATSASLITLKPLTMWILKNLKILKEMGIPDYLTCLMSNLYAAQESIVKIGHGTTDWF